MKRSGCMPKLLSAGGKSFREALIQIEVPLLPIRDDNNPAMKPLVAAASSGRTDKNSWIAPNGKVEFGNALFIGPNPQSMAALSAGLKP